MLLWCDLLLKFELGCNFLIAIIYFWNALIWFWKALIFGCTLFCIRFLNILRILYFIQYGRNVIES